MPDAFIYQAALLCEECAAVVRRDWHAANPTADMPEDSDAFPSGPHADGGGEADTPQHCDHCHLFLGNPLTDDGRRYVIEALARANGNAAVLAEWRDFYGCEWSLDGVDLDRFVDAYIECALWSSTHCNEEGDDCVTLDETEGDLSDQARAAMETDCRDFLASDRVLELVLLAMDADPKFTISSAGHDFWLTRVGHGAGFWDRGLGWIGDGLTKAAKSAGSRDLYLGDDGDIYQA